MPLSSYQCPLYDDDKPLVQWIALISGNCIYGDMNAMSWVLGWISFCIWLCAQLPQVVENYMNSSVEGVSLFFLVIWYTGDITNLIGCILTRQLPFQTALSLYYVTVDSILLYQYFYYTRMPQSWDTDASVLVGHDPYTTSTSEELSNKLNNEEVEDDTVVSVTVTVSNRTSRWRRLSSSSTSRLIAGMVTLASSLKRASSSPIYENDRSSNTDIIALQKRIYLIGQISAWTCAFMYLSSRIPQILKNFKRKSTWGLSIHLFIAALCGNLTYALSIIFSPDARGPDGYEFLRNELPYILGSAGTIIFDLIIYIQYLYYGNVHPRIAFLETDDDISTSAWIQPAASSSSRHESNLTNESTPLNTSFRSQYSA